MFGCKVSGEYYMCKSLLIDIVDATQWVGLVSQRGRTEERKNIQNVKDRNLVGAL